MRNALPLLILLLPVAIGGCTVLVENRFEPAVTDDAAVDASVNVDGGADSQVRDGASDAANDTGITPACLETCADATPLCDEIAGRCVACLTNDDCPNADASRCEAGACVGCAGNEDCGHVEGVPECSAGTCVQCTPETEEIRCGARACDPRDRVCTETVRGSLGLCQPCLADSECDSSGPSSPRGCVPVTYAGMAQGAVCLAQPVAPSSCPRRFPESIATTTRSGIQGTYCHPVQTITTCEAILDFQKDCQTDADCGAAGLPDGLCRGGRCTYECAGTSACPNGYECRTTSAPSYCCTVTSGC